MPGHLHVNLITALSIGCVTRMFFHLGGGAEFFDEAKGGGGKIFLQRQRGGGPETIGDR